MASHVQVVLRDKVEKLGKPGDLVRVKPGYARNYLIPRGLAAPATEGNVQQIEHEKRLAVVRAAKLRKEADALAQTLAQVVVEVQKTVGEEERLYGSVTAADVAQALHQKGLDIEKRKLKMPDEPIRQLGEYDISVKLAPEVTTTFKLRVVSK